MVLKEKKVDDLILCTVKKIEGATVFVETSSGEPGSIVLSEIAAGRIRNLRAHVSPNKKIVCKVLKVTSDHLELSLRRVTTKEKEEVLEADKKEKTLSSMLKSLSIEPKKIIDKIKDKIDIPEFLEEIREAPKLIEKFLPKAQAEKLHALLSQKKDKLFVLKKTITLSSSSPEGLNDIKSTLETKEAKIHYLGSSKFSISISSPKPKEAEKNYESLLKEIELRAKKKKLLFSIKEK